jgi:hypothetical protein
MNISLSGFCFSGIVPIVLLGVFLSGCHPPQRADGRYEIVFVWDGRVQKAQLFREHSDSEVGTPVRDNVLRNAEPSIAEQLKKANLGYAQGKLKVTVSGPPPYTFFTGAVEISTPNISELFAAVESENVDKIKLLVARNDNLNQKELPSERTAVFMAAAGSHVKSLRALLELGADPALPDFEGDSPLHAAVTADSQPAVEQLIAAGLNINCANGVGLTPLMVAANLGRIRVLELLLRSGADSSLKSRNGKTALSFARDAGQMKVVTILERSRESR